MNVKKCANGHFFDADKYQLCPHCGVAVEDDIPKNTAKEKKHHALSRKRREDQQDVMMKQMPQKTMGKTFGVFDEETKAEIKRSVIVSDPKSREEKKESAVKLTQACPSCGKVISATAHFCKYCGTPIKQQEPIAEAVQESVPAPQTEEQTLGGYIFEMSPEASAEPVSETEPATEIPQTQQEEHTPSLEDAVRSAVSGNDGRTIGFFSMGKSEGSQNDTEPVVGWLVCVKGRHFGESFQIAAGRNSVGRGVSNKIVLNKDNSVSREKHAWIVYEPKHREFFLQPGEGSGLSYLNGENIMAATKLKAKDMLEFGEGIYLLIPLCGEDFSWEEYIK